MTGERIAFGDAVVASGGITQSRPRLGAAHHIPAERFVACSLGGDVVASQIEMSMYRPVPVDALQQQTQRQRHHGWAFEVVELRSCSAAAGPTGQRRPEVRFEIEVARWDVQTDLVNQAAMPTRPDRGRRADLFTAVSYQAERPPAG